MRHVTVEPSQIEQEATASTTYPALGEPLAIEFANTLFTTSGQPLDAVTSPAGLTGWLAANRDRIDLRFPRRLGADELERARELRAVIRGLFAAAVDGDAPPARAIKRLNQLAALAPSTERLEWPAGELPKAHHSLAGAGRTDPLVALSALLAQSAIDVLGGSGTGRLRRCEAPGCINYYLKDHPRRAWCSPSCGNRVRVARHYQRHRRAES